MTLPFSKKESPNDNDQYDKSFCFRTEKSGSLRVSVQWSDTTLQTTACFFVVVGLRGGGGLRFAPNSAHFSYLTTMPVDATAFKNRLV